VLEVGNFNSMHPDDEGRMHFALWALYKSPLLIGTDLRKATAATKATLQATEVRPSACTSRCAAPRERVAAGVGTRGVAAFDRGRTHQQRNTRGGKGRGALRAVLPSRAPHITTTAAA
jgi:hypothetical protein